MKKLITQLKSLQHGKANPRAEWVNANRAMLLTQIKNTIAEKNKAVGFGERVWSGLSIFLPEPLVYRVIRPAAVVVLALTVVTTGFKGAAEASKQALPGEILYSAKRAGEGFELAVAKVTGIVANTKHSQAKLHVKFAKNRASEIKQITDSDDLAHRAIVLPKTVSDLQQELKSVTEQLETIKQSNNTTLSSDLAKGVQENTLEIKELLRKVELDVTAKATADPAESEKNLTRELRNAKETADATAFKVVEVAVATPSLSQDTVKEVVGTAIQTVATDAASSKEGVQGVKNIVEAVKDAVKSEMQKKSPTEDKAPAEALKQLTTVASQTKEAAEQIEEKSAKVEQKITEAQALVVSGKLSEAVEKIKEAKVENKEAKIILDTTLQNVLPIVKLKEDGESRSSSTTAKDVTVIVSTSTPASQGENKPSVVTVTVPSTPSVSQIMSSTPEIITKDEIKK